MNKIDLTESGNRLRDLCIYDIKNKKLTKFGSVNASGKTAASIQNIPTTNGYQIVGAAHIEELIFGRKPGAGRPISFEGIVEWMKIRGIKISPKVIIKSIIKKGNTVWQTYHGAESGLFNEAIATELPLLTKQIEDFTSAEISSEIFKNFLD